MRFLAIDPGTRRTGLAVGDDRTGIASPAGVIEAANPAQRLSAIRHAVAEHEPDALVVGLPLNMDGSEGPAATAARALAEQLRREVGLPVELADERLSSFAADEQLARRGLTHKDKKRRRDALAAANLLRSFLEKRSTRDRDEGDEAT